MVWVIYFSIFLSDISKNKKDIKLLAKSRISFKWNLWWRPLPLEVQSKAALSYQRNIFDIFENYKKQLQYLIDFQLRYVKIRLLKWHEHEHLRSFNSRTKFSKKLSIRALIYLSTPTHCWVFCRKSIIYLRSIFRSFFWRVKFFRRCFKIFTSCIEIQLCF